MDGLPWTRDEMNDMKCGTEGCPCRGKTGMYLRPDCHANAGAEPYYQDGLLHLRCKRCKASYFTLCVGDGLALAGALAAN